MRKKIIILSIIAIVLALAALAGVLYLKNKPELPSKIFQKTTAELKTEFEQKMAQNKTEVPINNRPVFTVSATDCEKINDKDVKANCLNYANYLTALSALDLKKCQNLPNDWADICTFKLVSSTKENFEACSSLKNSVVKDLCYQDAAIFLFDKSYCDKLSDSQAVSACQEKIIALRVDVNDINQCASIKTPGLFAVCVGNNPKPCSDFGDSNLAKQCEVWRFFDKIIRNNEKQYCEILPIENFQKVCSNYLEKNKYLDSDKDGSGDREELENGSDPFVYNEELKATKEAAKTQFSISRFLVGEQRKIEAALKQ